MDEEDYEYESDEEVEWTEEMLDMEQGDIPPAGCRADRRTIPILQNVM